uniref:Uncharacterized protein n=1 Tax=Florenciella parvula TaxID=236787 RepID=A0A7S2C0D1_9STRA|mmetsp:Transcript_22277/g.46346  ORF Transcript_22277/g.46346 Transcript_22277/m.46346 type:complete len:826 (+) Transcript_22277:40-2517(+)|eukprot:CAMPEP_0182546866 /NCGR_PEP_ID=MMETSP1323-20130603/36636_1 /TAXON_ID=236787 /ORGANISM="Florenciella parvula, Strain RCC1693" /LENGTH=825 /DNA_ID=CAMNT_0024758129 /DNA_START=37 /DNA_END=2514 /DNA_ORIENTATION=-
MQAAAAAVEKAEGGEGAGVGGNTALALTMASEGADALEYSQSMDANALAGVGGMGIERQTTEQIMAAATAATSDDGATTATSETEKMLAAAGVAKPSLKDVAVSVEKEEGPMTKQTPAGGTPAPKPGLTKQSTLALLNSTAKTMDVDEDGKPKASATEILKGVAAERAEAEKAEAEKLRNDPSAIQKALAKSFQETQVTNDEATTQLKFAAAEEANSATMAAKMGLTQEQIEMERANGTTAGMADYGYGGEDDAVYQSTKCTTGGNRRDKKPPETISRAGFLATRSSKPGGLGSFHLSQAHVALLANTRRIERGPYLMNTNGELLTDRKGRLILRADALKLLSKNMNPITQRKSASAREKEKKLKRTLAEVHGIKSEAEIERVVEFNNNENKQREGFKSTRQRINELARPEIQKDSGLDPELYLLGKDVMKRAKNFTKLDDAINCTFKPKVGKKWAEGGPKDDDEEKDEDNNFIKRQDAWFRETRAEMDMRRGKEAYDAGLNRKICPNCVQADGKLVYQAYDEFLEKRDSCSVCSSKYVNQNSWSKVAKGFFKQQDEFEVIKESNLKEAEKKYITDVCDPRKVMKTEFNEATGKFVKQPLFATYASEAEKEFLWQSYNSRTAADVDRRRSDQELWADKRMGSAKLMDPNCTFTPDLKDLSENNAPHLQGMHERITQFSFEDRMEEDVRRRLATQQARDDLAVKKEDKPTHLGGNGLLYEYRIDKSHVPEIMDWDANAEPALEKARKNGRAEAKGVGFDPISSGPSGRYSTEAKDSMANGVGHYQTNRSFSRSNGGGGAQAKAGGDPTDHYFDEAFSGVAEEKGGF